MINWPRALIIWGRCLHQHCANWVQSCSKNKNIQPKTGDWISVFGKSWNKVQENEPLGFRCRALGRPEEANILARESLCFPTRIAPTRSSQSTHHLHRNCHQLCPSSDVYNNLLLWDWDREAWIWLNITYRISAMLDPAKCPFLTASSLVPPLILLEFIYTLGYLQWMRRPLIWQKLETILHKST